jgi:hypothetical protein
MTAVTRVPMLHDGERPAYVNRVQTVHCTVVYAGIRCHHAVAQTLANGDVLVVGSVTWWVVDIQHS